MLKLRAAAIFLFPLLLLGAAHAQLPTPLTKRPSCSGGVLPPLRPQILSDQFLPRTQPFSSLASTIDLLIAYTPEALSKLGSEEAMLAEIKSMVAFANQAHTNSGTGVTFSLVAVEALDTDPTADFNTDLNAATYVDGVWDELLPLRRQVNADMVSVIVANDQNGELCGLAWLNGTTSPVVASSDFMFSIVSISRLCPRTTLVHELGHNMGSNHDRPNASGGAALSFSYGYNFTGSSGQGWHTIMAITANREIPYFSSPLLSFDGVAIGVEGSEDNVTSLSQFGPVVAGLALPLDLPDLATPARAEPDKIKTRYTLSPNRKRINITTTLTTGGEPSFYEPVEIYFSSGRNGPLNLRTIGRTNSKGRYRFKENSNVARGIFFRACYSKASPTFLCSRPYEISRALR